MRTLLASLLATLVVAAPSLASAQRVEPSFLYKLSSTTGVIPFHGASVTFDPSSKESIVFGGGRVTIFNPSGMEVFSFGEDPALGSIVGVAPTDGGDFVLLTVGEDGASEVRVANFRGEFVRKIAIQGLPDAVPRPLRANAIGWAKDRIYLADLGGMRLVVVGMDGQFLAFHDLAALCEVTEKRQDYGVKNLRVAPNGDVLFTVQALFRAFVLRENGEFIGFGQRGSAPGKFNVITGIASDERGYYYVVDILKSAVLVFDPKFRWVKEFGYRGVKPGSIVSPVDVAAGDGKVFVSQFARKGVSVFAVKVLEAP